MRHRASASDAPYSAPAATQPATTTVVLDALRARGITYLISAALPADDVAEHALTDAELVTALTLSQEPRIADALVSLLLLHPDLAAHLPWRRPPRATERAARERAFTRALAALYLQRGWATRLTLALGPAHAWLAEEPFAAMWRARRLPPPWLGDGAPGLAALAAWERRATGLPANYEDDWQNQARHLIQRGPRGVAQASATPYTITSLAPTPDEPRSRWRYDEQGAGLMSMRQPVDKSAIDAFLQELGRRVKQPGRLYLTGGAALVHAGIRGAGASTADIDLKLDPANENEVQDALRTLKNELNLDLELAWPGDFIPPPPTWESASQYVGRYGALDVFYVDFVTLALAKIARGSERDLRDVEALAQSGVLTREALEGAAAVIQPALGHGRYFNADPARFEAHLAATIQRIWGGGQPQS